MKYLIKDDVLVLGLSIDEWSVLKKIHDETQQEILSREYKRRRFYSLGGDPLSVGFPLKYKSRAKRWRVTATINRTIVQKILKHYEVGEHMDLDIFKTVSFLNEKRISERIVESPDHDLGLIDYRMNLRYDNYEDKMTDMLNHKGEEM